MSAIGRLGLTAGQSSRCRNEWRAHAQPLLKLIFASHFPFYSFLPLNSFAVSALARTKFSTILRQSPSARTVSPQMIPQRRHRAHNVGISAASTVHLQSLTCVRYPISCLRLTKCKRLSRSENRAISLYSLVSPLSG